MNKCYFQLWEESERGCGVRPDGCSIHLSPIDHSKYLNEIYLVRQSAVLIPDEYERISGGILECFISDSLFDSLKDRGSIRLMEHEVNNLIKLEELIFKK